MRMLVNSCKLAKKISPNYEVIKNIVPDCFRKVGVNNVAGSMFAMERPENLQTLYQNGIRTIVDFRAEATDSFKQACKQKGLKYFLFPLDLIKDFSNSKIFVKSANGEVQLTDKFVKDLQTFFNEINNGNVYMGCRYGVHRTNTALLLNYLLNPQGTVPIIKTMGGEQVNNLINSTLRAIKKIIHKLTPEQRKIFGLTDDFMSNEYIKKVGQLKKVNRLFYSC